MGDSVVRYPTHIPGALGNSFFVDTLTISFVTECVNGVFPLLSTHSLPSWSNVLILMHFMYSDIFLYQASVFDITNDTKVVRNEWSNE